MLIFLLGVVYSHAEIENRGAKDLGAIWFIGDSITQSNADNDPSGSLRKSLCDLLLKNDYKFSYTGHHTKNSEGLPETGTRPTDNLYHYHSGVSGILIGSEKSRGLFSMLPESWESGRLAVVKPRIILIMAGTNDVGRGFKLDQASDRLRALLDRIYELPNLGQVQVFLASIPPNRRNDDDRANVVVFNESVPLIVNEYKAKGKKIYYVDQFAALEEDYDENMCSDDLHPNGVGNHAMAKQWFEAIESAAAMPADQGGESLFPAERSDYRGYDSYSFQKDGVAIKVICPKSPNMRGASKPWLWRSLFWEAIPQFRDADLKLVDEGYYVVLVHGDVSGHPRGNTNIDTAYEVLTTEYGFSKTCSMASMSRGTLSLFRWAAGNPEKVESIYVDNGVCNIRSWPAGKLVPGNDSVAKGSPSAWKLFKKSFGFETDEEALASKESPIDQLEPLARAGVPILLVCGSKDPAVPYEENDAIMKQRYEKLGGSIKVIIEDKGHSHGMKDPTPVLEFIRKHTRR
ncbi:MAG: GDSL-type esterase/lipase family protein [Akkermansiaceae bacterium]